MSVERLVTYRCGCGARVSSVIFEKTGLRGVLELAARGDVAIVQTLPGLGPRDGIPRAVRVRNSTAWKEHLCPGRSAPSYSAANFNKKRRHAP